MYRRFGSILLIILLVAVPVAFSRGWTQAPEEILSNETIITLTKAGLSPSVIIGKIQSSKNKFDLSTPELLRLKDAKVSDEVIGAMFQAKQLETNKAKANAIDPSQVDPNDPKAPHEAGIYLLKTLSVAEKQMTQLEPSVYTQAKTSGILGNALTYGIKKVKSKAVLGGANARMQIDDPRPVFYFYFETKNAGLSNSGWSWFSAATSPNEFVLLQMEVTKNGREATVGEFNAYGAQGGVQDKQVRQIDFEKIAPGVFKVTPRADLANGEYVFFYGGSQQAAAYGVMLGSPKVFDFGVKARS